MPTTPLIADNTKNYELTVIINNPAIKEGIASDAGVEKITLWTNISPYDINVPAYILQNGFKYLFNLPNIYRFISPYHIISVYYDPKPTTEPKGYQLFQI